MNNPFTLAYRRPMEFGGIKVIESPDRPRFQLPESIPLVHGAVLEWPPGFRDEFNAWALEFLGVTNVVPKGQAYMLAGGSVCMMRPEDIAKLRLLNF